LPVAPGTLPHSAFWRFSLAFYARPGTAPACLALQDRYGADVNVVLLALWLGTQGHCLDAAAGARLARLARRWQDPLVTPLRRVRRGLKRRCRTTALPRPDALEDLRRRLAEVELGLEQVEQFLIEDAAGEIAAASPDEAVARHNLGALGLGRLAEAAETGFLLRSAFGA
jgi:uncharacterized protein (TIGR02444 family)